MLRGGVFDCNGVSFLKNFQCRLVPLSVLACRSPHTRTYTHTHTHTDTHTHTHRARERVAIPFPITPWGHVNLKPPSAHCSSSLFILSKLSLASCLLPSW